MARRFLTIPATMLVAVFVFAACGADPAPPAQPPQQQQQTGQQEQAATPATPTGDTSRTHLNVVSSNLPTSMFPAGRNDQPSSQITMQVFNRLIELDYDTFDARPSLATSWEFVDAQTLNMELRQGVTFHNGASMTARDVQWSIEQAIANPEFALIFGMVDSVEIHDDYNITVHLNIPFSPILRHLAHPGGGIIPYGTTRDQHEEHPIGTGSFMFESITLGDRLELVRFDDFWGELPLIETLTWRIIPTSDGRLLAVETGEADVALALMPPDVGPAEMFSNVNLMRRMNLSNDYIGFNTQMAPFDDPLVRQALNYAVDNMAIINVVLGGVGAPAQGFINDIIWGWHPTESFSFNPDRARELLAEAGHADGFSARLWTNSENQRRIDITTIVASQLRDVGIDVTLETFEFSTLTTRMDNGEHDMFMLGWVGVGGDADYGLFPLFHSDNFGPPGNRTFYSNPEVDRLLEAGRSATTDAERMSIYAEVQEILRDDAPWLLLNQNETLMAVSTDLRGLTLNPSDSHSFAGVWFE
ncbi:MAG: ABC transporter substrate-binding protein [Defluviitaleaceae bacterium]|nr:ABC transporter substrate-binding protein [Defluviitaleaceae bacterium]